MRATKSLILGFVIASAVSIIGAQQPAVLTPASALNGAGALLGKITSYNGVATVGWGVPSIVATGRVLAVSNAATASVATYTVGAADGSFEVSGNVNVTTATTHSFQLQVSFTDETNTARLLGIYLVNNTGGNTFTIVNTNGTGPYAGMPQLIRAKAGTVITVLTQAAGTYTAVVYNVEGMIKQVA
jgi:hypothetical protein